MNAAKNGNPLRSRKAEWLVTAPSFLWLALFFAVPAVIVLAFTFHGHDASGGVGDWSMSTWRELVDPDYPAIVWNTLRISFEITVWSIVLALPCAYAIARMNAKWRAIVAGSQRVRSCCSSSTRSPAASLTSCAPNAPSITSSPPS